MRHTRIQRALFTFIAILLLQPIALCASDELLNREWRYMPGDIAGAEAVAFDDDSWQSIGLPHSFSIPYFMSDKFYTGYGWYRRHLQLNRKDLKGRLWLVFEGVFQEAEVFLNGTPVGSHQGGYTAFHIDITDAARAGDNVIAVRVNNLWRATLAPRAGEHTFSGGIYRNVHLVKKNTAHLGWCGTTITTSRLEQTNGAEAVVTATCRPVGTQESRLRLTITDAAGKKVAQQTMSGTSVAVKMQHPKLWSPATPYLYTATLTLYDGKKKVDEEQWPLGMRWFRWTADEGFFLNGKHYFFHGANVHQDQAGWGDAITDEAARRDVRMVKEAGFDMIRGSHYPHSQAFVDECDRQGLLFWSEAPFWGTGGRRTEGTWTASAYPPNAADGTAFEASALQQLEEMIVQHRNHPSIFVWSMSNEPFFTDKETLPATKRLLARMVERAHQLDPTRKAAIGGAQRPLGDDRIDKIGDVAGYNGDGATIADFQKPGHPSVVSEYGSTTADRPGKYFPGWGDMGKDDHWKGRPWRSGQVIWCMYDHGSIAGADLGKMGIVDYFRIPKRSWYWYRNEYAHIAPPDWPVDGSPALLRLTTSASRPIRADGTDDTQLLVEVLDADGRLLSATPDVTLRIVSGPGELPTGRSITFSKGSDIRILDGQCAISLRSYYAGQTVVEATAEGLAPARLTLRFSDAPEYREGISPHVADRPYIKFTGTKPTATETFGLNNPTFSTTATDGHSAGNSTDGNEATYWQPLAADAAPSITLDTERTVIAQVVRHTTRGATPHIESSLDGSTWKTFAPGDKLRYVRLLFQTGEQPQVSHLEVIGRLAQ